jgi:hypothetical protein
MDMLKSSKEITRGNAEVKAKFIFKLSIDWHDCPRRF